MPGTRGCTSCPSCNCIYKNNAVPSLCDCGYELGKILIICASVKNCYSWFGTVCKLCPNFAESRGLICFLLKNFITNQHLIFIIFDFEYYSGGTYEKKTKAVDARLITPTLASVRMNAKVRLNLKRIFANLIIHCYREFQNGCLCRWILWFVENKSAL